MNEKMVGKKIFSKKRIFAVLILGVLVAVMIFSNPEVHKFLTESEEILLDFPSGMNYEAVTFGKEMLFVSNDGIKAVDSSGRESWSTVAATSSPMVDIENDFIMLADAGGNSINVYKNDKIISQIKTEREILTAKVNKNGYVAVATDELGYKGAVLVFDNHGKEVFKWYSGNGYIGDVDISGDKDIVVSQLVADKEQIYSRIMIIETNADDKSQCIAEVDGIVMKLKYKKNGGIIAVTDNGVHIFKRNGKEECKIDFEGRIPVGCNIENQGNMVFAFDSGLNNTIIESYSARGKLRGHYETDGKMLCFDVNGECILAATRNGVTRITPTGKERNHIEISGDVKKIKIFAGRDEFLSLGSGSAEILKIR